MYINLGGLAINEKKECRHWVMQIQRYKWLRFFGFSSKRLFIGFIVTSHDGSSPSTFHEDRVKFFEDNLGWAKHDLQEKYARQMREAAKEEGTA